jgi:hypothetical protein
MILKYFIQKITKMDEYFNNDLKFSIMQYLCYKDYSHIIKVKEEYRKKLIDIQTIKTYCNMKGITCWKFNNVFHREYDLPAIFDLSRTSKVIHAGISIVIKPIISKEWWYHGKRHRENDQPAIVCEDESFSTLKEWWVNDIRHRDNDNPALTYGNNHLEWWVNDKRHRDNDKPAFVNENHLEWWVNGIRHRDNDKPAITRGNSCLEWWVNGKRHRDNDHPAFIDGNYLEWWVNGKKCRELYNRF